jgi:predicted O-methyltransferase YrrM
MDTIQKAANQYYLNTVLMPFEGGGWIHPRFKQTFQEVFNLIKHPDIKIIEVGSWLGWSARIMAEQLRHEGYGQLIAIDTWLGSPEHYETENLEFLFQKFISNTIQAGLQNYIIPFRTSSLQAAHFLFSKQIQADIIYIDAAHEYEPVKLDIALFWKVLKPGGFMIFDDYDWDGVKQAVDEHCETFHLQLATHGALALVKK